MYACQKRKSGLNRLVPVLILLLLAGNLMAQVTGQPTAHLGVLDLRNIDISQQPVELRGEWKWYWHQLRSPSQPDSAFEYTRFPQLWRAGSWQRQPVPSRGYATYGLTILLPPRSAPLMLELPDQYSAYRLFVNGRELAHDGNPATTATATVPHWSTQLVELPAAADTLNLLLQLANFHHARGGSVEAIHLGGASRLRASLARAQAMDLFLAGCLVMTGLFFLGLYSFSRTDRSMLYYGLFCLAYSYRIVGTDEYVLHTLLPDLPWLFTLRLEYLSLYLALAVGVVYTRSLYPKDSHPLITGAMAWGCMGFAATVLLPPVMFTWLITPFLLLTVGYFGYISYIYWVAARRSRPGAVYSLMSTGLLLVVFGLIFLKYFGVATPAKPLLFAGYLGFFFLQSLVLCFRFSFTLSEARRTEKQFLANMSHEIRTPLNAILGFSSLLETTVLNREQGAFVSYIHTAGKNLLTIVNDILDIAKIEAGMLPLEIIPFNIHTLTSSIQVLLLPAATGKGLHLVVSADPALPPVLLGDPTRLTQILLNLVSNAIKFTPAGKVAVRVDSQDYMGDAVRVRFTVRDTGIGMTDEVLTHIFERFRQAHDSTTRYYGGTGLGLSIVKSLTELQGGRVTVTSTPGRGSCFTVEIPYQIASQSAAQPTDPTAAVWAPEERHLTILIVEDNPLNQKLALGVLSRLGHTAYLAGNGQQAIERLTDLTTDFDLILMDIQMPVMDGYEATRYIRTRLKTKIPIIAMTAHALATERQQCLQAGMNDFLTKPFLPQELQHLIRKYVPDALLSAPPAPVPQAPPGPAPTLTPPVDGYSIDPLLQAVDGDVQCAVDLLDLLLEQMPTHLRAVRLAIANDDPVRIGQLLHAQKAPIQMLGLTRISQQLHRIETLLTTDTTLTEATPLVDDYLHRLEMVLPAINTVRQTMLRQMPTG